MFPDVIHFGAIMEKRKAEMHTAPFPNVGSEDILIKVEAINICTADYHQWMGIRDHQGFPMAAGHEFAGRIVAVGEDVYKGFRVGMQVAATAPSCGSCPNCHKGIPHDCLGVNHEKRDENGFLGLKRFSDYIVARQNAVFPIDNPLPGPVAACAEPVACVLNGLRRARLSPLSDVAIIGAGPMGLLTAIAAKAWGCRVFLTEVEPSRIKKAKELDGITVIDASEENDVQLVKGMTEGEGVDVVFPIIGETQAYARCIDMLKPVFGKVVLWSANFPTPELLFDANELHYNKHEIIGSYGATHEEWQLSCQAISKRLIDPSPILDGRVFGLKDIQKAYEAASEPYSYRISIDPTIV